MTISLRHRVGVGAAVLLAAGGGVAFAATGHGSGAHRLAAYATDSHPRGGALDAAASYLGLTQQQLFTQLQSGKSLAQIANATNGKSASGLIDALVSAEKKEIAAAVSAGKLTQAQATQFESNLKQRVTDRVSGTFSGHPPFAGPRHDLSAAALSYLGLTADQLRAQLQSGKTLAQIADATSGKSAAGLVDALVAAAKKDIASAVSAGKLTQSQATQIAANLKQRITAEVNETRPAGGPRHGHPTGGPGGWGGYPPGMGANA